MEGLKKVLYAKFGSEFLSPCGSGLASVRLVSLDSIKREFFVVEGAP